MTDRSSSPISFSSGPRYLMRWVVLGQWLLGLILCSLAIFSIKPELDLFVSSLFFETGVGFPATSDPRVTIARRLIWGASQAMVLLALLGLFANVWARRQFVGIQSRLWIFVLAIYALGPGLMVDLITKPLWGRARPGTIADFGGELPFSTPFEFVDHCARNCSFVSGEVSGATAFSFSLLLITYAFKQRLPAVLFRIAFAVCILMPIASALQRIAAGAHFLSDTVFAILFTSLLAVAIGALLRLPLEAEPVPETRRPPAPDIPPSSS